MALGDISSNRSILSFFLLMTQRKVAELVLKGTLYLLVTIIKHSFHLKDYWRVFPDECSNGNILQSSLHNYIKPAGGYERCGFIWELREADLSSPSVLPVLS